MSSEFEGWEKAPLEPCILAPWFTQIKNACCVFNCVSHDLQKVLQVISITDGAKSYTYMMYPLKTAFRNSEIWDRGGFSKLRTVLGLSISKWLFAAVVIFYILSLLLPFCFLVFSPYLNLFASVFLIKHFCSLDALCAYVKLAIWAVPVQCRVTSLALLPAWVGNSKVLVQKDTVDFGGP